ncbi:MAG: protein kinase domain-containing protein [Polyangiaceae bacterium]
MAGDKDDEALTPTINAPGLHVTRESARPRGLVTTPSPSSDESVVPSSTYPDYVVSAEQGRGGLGRVLRAHDRRLGRTVALKELLVIDTSTAARFLREARLTARLQHPSIVPVYELGLRVDGAPFYAMKLIAGEPLDKRIARLASLDERLALLPNMLAVADAVAYAHEHRIIHRDLKPSNLIVGDFGETVVIDWGLAKDLTAETSPSETPSDAPGSLEKSAGSINPQGPFALEATLLDMPTDGSDRTRQGAAVGTLAYMPPEQLHSGDVDERADVFSLGACLYQLVTGVAPYGEWARGEVMKIIETAAPIPIEAREPGVPTELAAIVRKAMARWPGDRYPTAKELAVDLRRFQTGQLVGAHNYSRRVLFARWVAAHRRGLFTAAAFVVALGAVGALSVRRIVRERDRAEAERHRADDERRVAQARSMQLTVVQARTSLDRDPTASLAWLKTYPDTGPEQSAVATIAADAFDRGVATQVLSIADASSGEAMSTDGRWVAASDSGQIRIWARATGHLQGTYAVEHANGLAFSPDGAALVAGGSNGAVFAIDLASGASRPLAGHSARIQDLVRSPDERGFATCGDDKSVRYWSWGTYASRVLGAHDNACEALQFSPDGARLATTGADDTLRIWPVRERDDAGNATAVLKLALGAGSQQTHVAWSVDGRHVATADGAGSLRLWDIDAQTSRPLVGHQGGVYSMRFAENGASLLSVGQDSALHLWDVSGHAAPRLLAGHTGAISSVAVSGDGAQAVTCGDDATARVWDLHRGTSRTLLGHVGPVIACDISSDGREIMTSGIGSARVWRAPPPEVVLRGHEGAVHRIAWSRQGDRIASASDDHTARIWNAGTGRLEATLDGLDRRVGAVLFLGADGDRVVFTNDGGAVRVWDSARQSFLHDFSVGAKVRDLLATRDGKTVIVPASDGTVHVLDVVTGTERQFRASEGRANGASLSPDEQVLATTGQDGSVRLWDLATGTPRAVMTGHTAESVAVRFSADGSLLASVGADGTVRLWDPRTGAARRVLTGFTGSASYLAFGLDGSHVYAGGTDATIRDWSATTGEMGLLSGHADPVRALGVSPDGRLLISCAEDATTRLWDVSNDRVVALFRSTAAVLDASFSPDGKQIAAADLNGVIRIRAVDAGSFLPAAPEALRGWLDRQTTAVVDERGRVASP